MILEESELNRVEKILQPHTLEYQHVFEFEGCLMVSNGDHVYGIFDGGFHIFHDFGFGRSWHLKGLIEQQKHYVFEQYLRARMASK